MGRRAARPVGRPPKREVRRSGRDKAVKVSYVNNADDFSEDNDEDESDTGSDDEDELSIEVGGRQMRKRPAIKTKKLKKLTAAQLKAQYQAQRNEQSARSKVRQDIAENTRPKRDNFLLAHSHLFLPLLPERNYITKLQSAHGTPKEPEFVEFVDILSQPDKVLAKMKPYQLEGLSFLVKMFRNGMSAILGDEMGLGKTLQTLALFEYLREHHSLSGEHRPHLVVCPLSVLSSWVAEVEKWCPQLHVLRFHGPKAERDRMKKEAVGKLDRYGHASTDNRPFDIVVTSYEIFVAEQNWFKVAFAWRYIVLDEGHKIKNPDSDVSASLQSIKAENRLLLTGTPLQNNLYEMWALLHWLYPDVFAANTADRFREAFDLSAGKASTSFMDHARRLLELVMLRRMKGSPGVDLGLPPKEVVHLYVPLTPMQRFWYMRLLTKAGNAVLDDLFKDARAKEMQAIKAEAGEDKQLVEQADTSITADTSMDLGGAEWAESREIVAQTLQTENVDERKGSEWRRLMNLLTQLRKACSHPYILRNAVPDPYYLGDHVRTASSKFIVLDKLIEELVIRQKRKILIFAGWTTTLDLVEDLLALRGANAQTDAPFHYMRFDGGTPRARRNLGIRLFNDRTSDFRVMLISTRAGGLGLNLATASEVVFLDEDWNPQITLQAEARAHRIGQTQKVTVYKICTQGTVEEQMLGRIRKKLYLSAKITESMRNIHGGAAGTKRKRGRPSDSGMAPEDEDGPQLATSDLKTLLRRGAQTLSRPQVDVTEMLAWDWQNTLDKCRHDDDKPVAGEDTKPTTSTPADADVDEEAWLTTMERVECAVFEGKKHDRLLAAAEADAAKNLSRADRRAGKNTTVMIDGFAINKESLACGAWEAVPTLSGKGDARLMEPPKRKQVEVENQDHCQVCHDGGELYLCAGCPRAYHAACLPDEDLRSAGGGIARFYCPQHRCADCGKKTAEAGGLVFRCRWCEGGYCEDCLGVRGWDGVRLLGASLPEMEVLGYDSHGMAWWVDCHECVRMEGESEEWRGWVKEERERYGREYRAWLGEREEAVEGKDMGHELLPATANQLNLPGRAGVNGWEKADG